MKKVLLTSTALVLSAGVAAADVSVGGDGRMGVLQPFGDGDVVFTSRIRISFSASGETDSGLTFGGSIRADNASTVDGGGDVGTAGSVFVEGSFGKLSMGDVSGAPEAAVGDLSGVGLTGLGDANEFVYVSNAVRPAVRYDYIMGDLGFHVSADSPDTGDAYGVAVSYSMGNFSMGLGYEDSSLVGGTTIFSSRGGQTTAIALPGTAADSVDISHIIGGVTATFGDVTAKAIYGTADLDGGTGALAGTDASFDQYGFSLDYVMGATTLTGYYAKYDVSGTVVADADAYGIGAAYDLGGGASLEGGWARVDTSAASSDSFDFGLSMSF